MILYVCIFYTCICMYDLYYICVCMRIYDFIFVYVCMILYINSIWHLICHKNTTNQRNNAQKFA